jgi:hypothetical protein
MVEQTLLSPVIREGKPSLLMKCIFKIRAGASNDNPEFVEIWFLPDNNRKYFLRSTG